MNWETPKEKLSLEIIESLKNKGWKQVDIAKEVEVTPQHVSWILKTYGGHLTPRQRILRSFPFQTSEPMSQASPCRRLRDHGEYVATGGVGMSPQKLTRLRNFYIKLRDQVIEFDPSIPPIEGVSTAGGWAYRPRVLTDGDLLIRVNEHTHLTDEGKMIWRFPPVEP